MRRETDNLRENDNTNPVAYLNVSEMEELPTVALRGLAILPGMVIHFDLNRKKSIEAVEQAMLNDQRLLVVTQKSTEVEEPEFDDVYDVGTVTVIKQVTKLPGHT